MDITLRPFVVESDYGAAEFWDWSVKTKSGLVLAGIESSASAARFYIMVAVFRFMFTRIPE